MKPGISIESILSNHAFYKDNLSCRYSMTESSFNDKPVLLRTLVKTKEASNGAEEEGLHVAEPFVEFAIRKA